MINLRNDSMLNIRGLVVGLLLLPMLSACAKTDVPVSIHGINYSGDIFRYFIVDPSDVKNQGGGETIDPYGAGGTVCCFSLPKKWRPGIKVQIKATHWVSNKDDDKLKEISESKVVEVPDYADGKPGELWVMRGAKGELSLVSSDYQPDHAKWPGVIKGWPVSSVEYRRERWQIYMDIEKQNLSSYIEESKSFEKNRQIYSKELWDVVKQHRPKDLEPYSGPNDPRYIESIKVDLADGLIRTKKNIEELRRQRP
jgi:hypothetical protein